MQAPIDTRPVKAQAQIRRFQTRTAFALTTTPRERAPLLENRETQDSRPPRGSRLNNRGRSSWSDKAAIRSGTMQARIDACPVVTRGEEAGKLQVKQSHDRRHGRRTSVLSRDFPNQTETSSSDASSSGSGRNGAREDHEIRIVGNPAEEGILGFSCPGTHSFYDYHFLCYNASRRIPGSRKALDTGLSRM